MLKRNFFNLIAFLFITFLWCTSLGGTILINPTGDGGFETGTTFDANGWTIVGTSDNHYFVGTAPGQYAGERCAFISNEASSWVGTLSSIFRHMYRNVLFPDNETEITLTFLYKINTVETTGIDHFRIYLIDTTTTPQANGYPQGDLIYKSNLSGITANTWETLSISIPANYAGFRKRLVISWYNNNAHPNTVIAFDNIELTSKVPDIISNLPYTTDMTPVKNIVSMPSGWMNLKSSANYPWIITTNNNIGYHSSPYIAIINKSSAAAKNEWLISPPVSVVNGNAYIINFWVKAPGSGSNPEKLKVHWGTAPTVQALTANTAIYDNPNMFITDWTEVSINFTATTTRNIYFGWHGYSAADVDYIALDDISILPATPIMTISESAYDFGLAYIGEETCTPHTFTATNSGAGTIIISNSPIITGADADQFELTDTNTYPINLTTDQTASWTVKFNPKTSTAYGEKTAYLNILDNLKSGIEFRISDSGQLQNGENPIFKSSSASYKADPIYNQKRKSSVITMFDNKVINNYGRRNSRASNSINLRGFAVNKINYDDEESLDDFNYTDLSPWTLYDEDGSATIGIQDYTFTNQNYTGSFIVFNPSSTSPSLTTEGWRPYSGNKYFACFAAQTPPNNDWLISPQLIFESQPRISFYAKSLTSDYGLERFKVLYSITGPAIENFAGNYLAGSETTYEEAPVNWTKYEYSVPVSRGNSFWIAIQCVSDNAFVFMVDNFVSGDAKTIYTLNVNSTGFNQPGTDIYRNSKDIGFNTNHTFTAVGQDQLNQIIGSYSPGAPPDGYYWVNPIITIAAEDFNEVNNYTVTINFILEAENLLPVELSSFSAIATAQNYVMIEWTTQSETNVSGFYLFRNTENDLSAAERINAFIAANNTSHETDYVLYDREVLCGHTYYYWLQNIDLNGEFDFHGPVSVTISSGANNIPDIPINTGLQVVYPNPFIDQATIAFGLTKDEEVKVIIFNTKGELIRNLYSGSKKAGNYRVFWDGCNDRGKAAPSGIYFVRMKAGKNNSSLMLTLIK
ncbi:MAG: choice-of-anchor J domain-containing protein [Candidatus Cloacimonadaceae bacterium]